LLSVVDAYRQEALVFDKLLGLPAHPLLVHAAVIFIPLLVLGAVVYGLFPQFRAKIDWAVAALAVAAPFAALFAKLSGDKLRARLVDQGLAGQTLTRVNEHRSLAGLTLYFTIGLGVATLLMMFMLSRRAGSLPPWSTIAIRVVVLALAGTSAYYVFWTGDAGARAVWGS
jgi:hypothetical protein